MPIFQAWAGQQTDAHGTLHQERHRRAGQQHGDSNTSSSSSERSAVSQVKLLLRLLHNQLPGRSSGHRTLKAWLSSCHGTPRRCGSSARV